MNSLINATSLVPNGVVCMRSFAHDEVKPAGRWLRQSVTQLRRISRTHPELAGNQSVYFLTNLGSALENVDPTSRTVTTAVRKSVQAIVHLFVALPVSTLMYDQWLEQLAALLERENDRGQCWQELAIHWGLLCKSPILASYWADRWLPHIRQRWKLAQFKQPNSLACLASLAASARWQEILDLLAQQPIGFWPEQRFGVMALAAQGKSTEALTYAQHANPLGHEYRREIAESCEAILLAQGLRQRAYEEFAIIANQRQNHLRTFKVIAEKYPEKPPEQIFEDLVKSTPGEEGKWFRVAYELRFFHLALEISQTAPCDPKTLIHAAKEHSTADPTFACRVSLASLRWLAQGYGVSITANDVYQAYDMAIQSAADKPKVFKLMRQYCEGSHPAAQWLRELLAREL